MVYYNPLITGVGFHPQKNLDNHGPFFSLLECTSLIKASLSIEKFRRKVMGLELILLKPIGIGFLLNDKFAGKNTHLCWFEVGMCLIFAASDI